MTTICWSFFNITTWLRVNSEQLHSHIEARGYADDYGLKRKCRLSLRSGVVGGRCVDIVKIGSWLISPQKVVFGLFVLGFASANTPSPLKQHSQAHLTERVSTLTQWQKWRLFVFSVR